MAEIKTTILGCGSSGGVPRADGNFGVCDPNVKENYRTRCSILVEKFNDDINALPTSVLIDTSPDLRMQLLNSRVSYLDAILFTHDHADQTHGIDDIRALVYSNQSMIDAYMEDETYKTLIARFGYIFKGYEIKGYPPLLNPIKMPPYNDKFSISGRGGDFEFIPLEQIHGHIKSVGFRYYDTAYCNDLNILPDAAKEHLGNLEYFIVDALRYSPHPSHAHLDLALSWVEELKPNKTILTNLHIDMDYNELLRNLPDNVIPAYDGMQIIQKI